MASQLIKRVLNLFPRPLLIRASYFIRPVLSFIYRGDKFECPVCNHTFRKLLPYGYEVVRENALCPHCLSLERHRLLWIFLQNETDFFEKEYKVLHIAPEQCFLERFKKLQNLDYTTGDLESPIAMVHFDVQDIPFKDQEFDIVICNHVLEHVPDFEKAAKEILRVTKKEGFAILQVPIDFNRTETFEDPTITDPEERRKIFGQYDHVRVFGTDYPNKLRIIGFEIREDNFTDQLPYSTKEKYCLPKKDFLFRLYKA